MAKFSDIVHPGYSSANSINLRIDMEDGITLDDKNQVIFRMEKHFSHHRRRVILDASSKSVCILHKKKGTTHGRWEVCRGSDTSQVSFIVKKSSMMSSTESIDLGVFLPNNTEESVCKLKASRKKNYCQIYTRGGSTLANAKGLKENKNGMEVEIEADVDHAFIVALLAIVDEKKMKRFKKGCIGMLNVTTGAIATAGLIGEIVQFADA